MILISFCWSHLIIGIHDIARQEHIFKDHMLTSTCLFFVVRLLRPTPPPFPSKINDKRGITLCYLVMIALQFLLEHKMKVKCSHRIFMCNNVISYWTVVSAGQYMNKNVQYSCCFFYLTAKRHFRSDVINYYPFMETSLQKEWNISLCLCDSRHSEVMSSGETNMETCTSSDERIDIKRVRIESTK